MGFTVIGHPVAFLALAQHLYSSVSITNTPRHPYFSRKACVLSCDGFTVCFPGHPHRLISVRPHVFIQCTCFSLLSRARHFTFTLHGPLFTTTEMRKTTDYKFLKNIPELPHHTPPFQVIKNIYT
jgi:hypothetical protein